MSGPRRRNRHSQRPAFALPFPRERRIGGRKRPRADRPCVVESCPPDAQREVCGIRYASIVPERTGLQGNRSIAERIGESPAAERWPPGADPRRALWGRTGIRDPTRRIDRFPQPVDPRHRSECLALRAGLITGLPARVERNPPEFGSNSDPTQKSIGVVPETTSCAGRIE